MRSGSSSRGRLSGAPPREGARCLNPSSAVSATCRASTACGRSRCSAVIVYHLGLRLGAGRPARRRRLLHALRLPDHRSPAGPGRARRHPAQVFWLARARRLLPALFVMLVVVTAWVTVIGPHQPPDFREAVGTAAFYVNNWWLIFHDVSYFAQFATPGAAQPPVVAVGRGAVLHRLAVPAAARPQAGRRGHALDRRRFRLGGAILALALASGVLMAVLYSPGIDPSRVYYGTDTRALELLVGAALATVWPSSPAARPDLSPGAPGDRRSAARWACRDRPDVLARRRVLAVPVPRRLPPALAGDGAGRRGVRPPRLPAGPIVGCAPLRWIGERSYGIYLWHFPIIVLTTPDGAGHRPARGALQVAATIAVAALSWKLRREPDSPRGPAPAPGADRPGCWRRERLTPRRWAVARRRPA